MLKLILILLIGLPNLAETTQCVAQYGQCGGTDYTGSTQCCASSTCVYINLWYSQCIPSSASSTTSCSAVYGQCGGVNWSGPTCCDASTCTYSNAYYSQCLPAPSSSSSSSSSSSTSSSSTSTTTTTTTTTPSSASQSGGGSGCNSVYSQCGGQNWPGSTCCVNSICIYSNPYYSQCLPTSSPSSSSSSTDSTTTQSSSTTSSTSSTTPSTSSTTSSTSSTTPSTSSTTTANQGCSAVWEQCGGIGWNGPTTCCSGSTCTFANSYYSQCIPSSESSTSPSSSTSSISSTTIPSGDGNRQPGVTTRYWDCCKASCGWPGKASVSNPVQTCAQDGIAPVSANNQSVCTGGTGYMCINQQPWNVSSTLSYGYAAAHISGQGESDWCCACYSLIFTSGPVIGKELIVQITNTGGDLGNNHFDLQMPGGGVGLFDGCSRQFPGPYSWGQTYGGVSERSNCSKLPVPIQTGCYWRFDWFMNADNPTVDFKQVACPSVLTDKTQCIRR